MKGYGAIVTAFSGITVIKTPEIPDAELAVDGCDFTAPIELSPVYVNINGSKVLITDIQSIDDMKYQTSVTLNSAMFNTGENWLGDY